MRIEKKGTWMWNLRTLEQWRELGWRLWDRPHRVQVDPPHPNPGFQECPPIVKEGMVTNALYLQFFLSKDNFPGRCQSRQFLCNPSLSIVRKWRRKNCVREQTCVGASKLMCSAPGTAFESSSSSDRVLSLMLRLYKNWLLAPPPESNCVDVFLNSGSTSNSRSNLLKIASQDPYIMCISIPTCTYMEVNCVALKICLKIKSCFIDHTCSWCCWDSFPRWP